MDMILEALKVMLFGMLGIFFVMSLIIIFVQLLNFFQKNKPQEVSDGSGSDGSEDSEDSDDSDDSDEEQ